MFEHLVGLVKADGKSVRKQFMMAKHILAQRSTLFVATADNTASAKAPVVKARHKRNRRLLVALAASCASADERKWASSCAMISL
jgi:hypothetical protein